MIVRRDDKIAVVGVTGRQGAFWSEKMIVYGTNVVAGISPKREGEFHCGVPIFGSSLEAAQQSGAEVAVMFIPPAVARAAVVSAIEAGFRLIVALTEHIPVHDVMFMHAAAAHHQARIVGPNTAGLVTPGECFVGIMPAFVPRVFAPGRIRRHFAQRESRHVDMPQSHARRPRTICLHWNRRRPNDWNDHA